MKFEMKIGIFGGTFDPVHIGHLRAAEEFGKMLGLDQVLMMVSGVPPHRPAPSVAATDRLKMLQLAVRGNPLFEVSEMELSRKGSGRSGLTSGGRSPTWPLGWMHTWKSVPGINPAIFWLKRTSLSSPAPVSRWTLSPRSPLSFPVDTVRRGISLCIRAGPP